MSYVPIGATAGTGAAAAAAIAKAIKASGAIVSLKSEEFQKIINKQKDPLIVYAEGGLFTKNFQYLTNYKGLHFYCKSAEPLILSSGAETVMSKKIWIPG